MEEEGRTKEKQTMEEQIEDSNRTMSQMYFFLMILVVEVNNTGRGQGGKNPYKNSVETCFFPIHHKMSQKYHI